MKLLEHEAKQLLAASGIAVPRGQLVQPGDTTAITTPVVLKAQVLPGRRNQFGGIRIVTDVNEIATATKAVFAATIDGLQADSLLAEELLAISQEYYLSLFIDRKTAATTLLAHKDGGVEIESHNADEFFRTPLSPHTITAAARQLADYLDLHSHEFILEELLTNLLKCFRTNDATLLEINPLVLTNSDTLVAADCKLTLDDAASFRHPEWSSYYDKPASHNFVTLAANGTVATIANGAGLAMATVDAVEAAGLQAANFLDIGGGATQATILAAFTRLAAFSQVQAIVINIFAGITRADEVANAIIAARQSIPDLPALYIRIDGSRADIAATLLAKASIPLYPTLSTAIAAVKEASDV
ncbi:MAG: hypothetical protein Q4B06_02810 [Candidatus Saccharibacteria bacterium]|nr:hypothetical protein [Candidatus Saccharibacteria bacterium]